MDFLGIGFSELMFILIIAMMVFGPKRLPEMAGKAGKIIRDLRGMSQGLMTEWQRELNVSVRLDELNEIRQELEETKKALTTAKKDIEAETSTVTKVANEAAKSTKEAVTSMTKPLEEKPKTPYDADQLSDAEPASEPVVASEHNNGTSDRSATKDGILTPLEVSTENSASEPIIDARLVTDTGKNDVSAIPVPVDTSLEAASAELKEVANE